MRIGTVNVPLPDPGYAQRRGAMTRKLLSVVQRARDGNKNQHTALRTDHIQIVDFHSSRPRYFREDDLYDLYASAHFAGWEPSNLPSNLHHLPIAPIFK